MFEKLRSSAKRADAELEASISDIITIAEDFSEKLIGISVNKMRDIEAKGLALCKERYTEIKAEIARLEIEARNTAAIIEASTLKLDKLSTFGTVPGDKPEVPPMTHTDINSGGMPTAEEEAISAQEAATK